MAANLTPQYKEAERRYREAIGHEEKLAALHEMMALLPKHKGTEKLQGDIRRRVAKLEEEAEHGSRAGAKHADPGYVHREGAGQWVLIGPPNAGKSAILRALTHARPEVAAYPFTTHAPQPGMMPFEDVQVQLIDTPAVAAHRVEPYMANLAHNADGVLLVLDPTDDDLEESLAACRALLDKARVLARGAPPPPDVSPFTVERPVIVALNKADLDPDGVLAGLAEESVAAGPAVIRVSAEHGTALEELRRRLFEELRIVRVYAKEPGKKPDLERPFVLPAGATAYDLAVRVHKEIAERLKFARVWGHARFDGQQVERSYVLADRDVVELHA
jgi:hypothetical protein